MIRSYLRDTINGHKTKGKQEVHSGNTVIDHKTEGEWQIQLSITINFIARYKEGLEESMRRSEFILGSVDLLKYKFNEISLRRGRSSIDSPKWLKNKKETINPKNNDGYCFQYALTVALNYQNIKKDSQII